MRGHARLDKLERKALKRRGPAGPPSFVVNLPRKDGAELPGGTRMGGGLVAFYEPQESQR